MGSEPLTDEALVRVQTRADRNDLACALDDRHRLLATIRSEREARQRAESQLEEWIRDGATTIRVERALRQRAERERDEAAARAAAETERADIGHRDLAARAEESRALAERYMRERDEALNRAEKAERALAALTSGDEPNDCCEGHGPIHTPGCETDPFVRAASEARVAALSEAAEECDAEARRRDAGGMGLYWHMAMAVRALTTPEALARHREREARRDAVIEAARRCAEYTGTVSDALLVAAVDALETKPE